MIKNKTIEQKEGFLGMLLGTLRASLVGGNGIVRTGYENKDGKGMLRAA